MQGVWRELLGQPLELALWCFCRARWQKAIGRWLRGREEFRKLARTEHVLMSWGKSGRTWLRVMLSRFIELAYGVPMAACSSSTTSTGSTAGSPALSSPMATICATTPATGRPKRSSTARGS